MLYRQKPFWEKKERESKEHKADLHSILLHGIIVNNSEGVVVARDPSKSEIGRVSKTILSGIVRDVRERCQSTPGRIQTQ